MAIVSLKDHITEFDVIMMRRTLELAAGGRGLVSPNPLVGCIVVSPEGEIAGEGTYFNDRVTHAEAIALEQAGHKASGGTAYISLEPHHHHSKTPPCTEALINAGIKRVVCPIEDPNPLVSGRGFDALRESGIEVVTGVLAADAAKLNEKFICWHRSGRTRRSRTVRGLPAARRPGLPGRPTGGRGLRAGSAGGSARRRRGGCGCPAGAGRTARNPKRGSPVDGTPGTLVRGTLVRENHQNRKAQV